MITHYESKMLFLMKYIYKSCPFCDRPYILEGPKRNITKLKRDTGKVKFYDTIRQDYIDADHIMQNTEVNRELYPNLINSILNLRPVHNSCHINNRKNGYTYIEAEQLETAIKNLSEYEREIIEFERSASDNEIGSTLHKILKNTK